MTSATLDIHGMRMHVEVLAVARFPDQKRAVITVHARERLERGHSGALVDSTGRNLDCVITDVSPVGNVFLVELKCIDDAVHFDDGEGMVESAGA